MSISGWVGYRPQPRATRPARMGSREMRDECSAAFRRWASDNRLKAALRRVIFTVASSVLGMYPSSTQRAFEQRAAQQAPAWAARPLAVIWIAQLQAAANLLAAAVDQAAQVLAKIT